MNSVGLNWSKYFWIPGNFVSEKLINFCAFSQIILEMILTFRLFLMQWAPKEFPLPESPADVGKAIILFMEILGIS